MKGLHWVKVPDMEIEKTMWAKGVDDEGIRKQIDIMELEENFKVKAAAVSSMFPHFFVRSLSKLCLSLFYCFFL